MITTTTTIILCICSFFAGVTVTFVAMTDLTGGEDEAD